MLLGTSVPLLTRVTENPSNVGQSYYFVTMTPIAIAALLLLALFPAFRWNSGLSRKRLLLIGAGAGLLTAVALAVAGHGSRIIHLLLFSSAAWAVTSNCVVLFESWWAGRFNSGYLTHVGLAIAITGAGSSAGFNTTELVTLEQGQTVQAMGYDITFTDIVETPKGFDCHVDVSNGDDQFVAVLPHEFPPNAEGVMKKPHVENYWTGDLYLSPNSFESAPTNDAGTVQLLKGESVAVGKYQVTFNDFDILNHGDEEMVVAAMLKIAYEGLAEDVAPVIRASGWAVEAEPAAFDSGAGEVTIAGVRPEDGGVTLQFVGNVLPTTKADNAIFIVELSWKPFILLFWIGTILMFVGGGLSMAVWRHRHALPSVSGNQEEDQKIRASALTRSS